MNENLVNRWSLSEDVIQDDNRPSGKTVTYEDAEVIDTDLPINHDVSDEDSPSDGSTGGDPISDSPDAAAVLVLEEDPDAVPAHQTEGFVLRENDQYDPVIVNDPSDDDGYRHDEDTTTSVDVTHATERPLIPIDLDQKLPSFDDLPSQPKRGSVKTVCPTCQAKTRHVKDATCRVCGEQNGWLAQRWGLLEPGQAVVQPRRPEPSDTVHPVKPMVSKVSVTRSGPWCGSCQRVSRADLYDACIFCGTAMEVDAP